MRRVLAPLLLIAALVVAAGPADAKAKPKYGPEETACVLAAILYDGTGDSIGLTGLMVSTRPFPALTASDDKSLRKVVTALVRKPHDAVAISRFGAWCQKHFPDNRDVQKSPFETL